MGSCYSIHIIHPDYKTAIKHECFICLETISENLVKCTKCKIFLHDTCVLRYIQKDKNARCPNCQYKKVLYSYKNTDWIMIK
jgi:DNA-directed RNA polymerase subunit RPC12/RpoP